MFLIVYFLSLVMYAQKETFESVCYTKEHKESIRVTSELDISTLSFLDKLKFVEKEYIEVHETYINDEGYVAQDITTKSHMNMYPEWYAPPSRIRIDQEGIKTYVSNTHPLLPQNWEEDYLIDPFYGEYLTDAETGEKYLFQAYTDIDLEHYQLMNSVMQSSGGVENLTYKIPDATQLNNFRQEGYSVIEENGTTTVKDDTKILIWKDGEKAVIVQVIEGDILQNTQKMYYEYVDEYDDYLITKMTTNTPSVFDNGDCYEMVTETIFSKYANSCESKDEKAKPQEQASLVLSQEDLAIHPNPASDMLNIVIPNSNQPSILTIVDISGSVLLQRTLNNKISNYEVKVNAFPSGMYMLKVQQGAQIYSSKFVKK